ncbi:uncharacterized protein BDV14DRAFT_199712 [Aspergillus stella-maris]|uniref:uncharacterized protein n=1 Tax=Aspergillus stella-maris TaxID=1810926 RepID=UPI003CCD6F0B
MVVSWVTTLDVYNMTFWQNLPGRNAALKQGIVYSKTDPEDPTLNFTWVTQLYNFDLAVSNVFFFWINANVPGEAIPSAYFIITEPDRESTLSSSSSSSTSTSTSTSTSPTSETSSLTSTPTGNNTTTDPNPSSPSRNSTSSESDSSTSTNKTALGVGLGVGIPVLGALAALI